MEILSPASNMEHIRVAIDEKANAVYGGLKKWNARNKAINFTTNEYNLLIKELHDNNIKFFLTLNILMLDNEIKEVIHFLKNNNLPDAFIVTDVGLSIELHKEFPNVPLHFSTQFGAHSIDDVNYIKLLNGSRAILARELTLNELNRIKSNTNIELECFVWGSQCLSFSGLCFFGTLINGGGGNRGKCIITCRDIYSINNKKGHYLYVPDMDCIRLISKLDGIQCLKIEGRRRKPEEIKKVLKQIFNRKYPYQSKGYLLGKNICENGLYERINSRIKPVMRAAELDNIDDNDICIRYIDSIPEEFSNDYEDPNVMYVCSEIKKSYKVNKRNISFDFILENNIVKEVLYLNYRGNGHTFFSEKSDLIEIDLNEFIDSVERIDSNINIYKISYKKSNNKSIRINKYTYNELIKYILSDCKLNEYHINYKKRKLKYLYLDTTDINVVNEYLDDDFVRIIYDIGTINNLKNINRIIKKYNDKIIYKLPLFNWNSENILPYLQLLEGKEVMFTRFTQINLFKNINLKKKYADYTIYIWNKKTLKYLKDNGFDEFTASPELSYETNTKIFENEMMQVIIGGKLPLVYTRNCFNHLFGCINCKNTQCTKKTIKNDDKNLEFEVLCNNDYRYILYKHPILNNYSKIDINDNTKFKYITNGQSIDEIRNSIRCFKSDNYFNELKKSDFWKNSYECNLLEGRE